MLPAIDGQIFLFVDKAISYISVRRRKVSRGNIQLIKLNERMGYELDVVNSWVDAILEKQKVEADGRQIEAQKVRVFQVSSRNGWWEESSFEVVQKSCPRPKVPCVLCCWSQDKEYLVTPLKGQICCCGLCGPTTCCFTTCPDSSCCAPTVVKLKLEQEEVRRHPHQQRKEKKGKRYVMVDTDCLTIFSHTARYHLIPFADVSPSSFSSSS